MTLPLRRFLPVLTATFGFAAAASAQFSPYGSTTINTTTTAAQTLASGTGTITSSGAINDSGTSVALTLSGTGTTLLNYGSILNTNANAAGSSTTRALRADGTNLQITNESGGLIQSTGDDTVRSSTAGTSITFTNYGTIQGLNTSTSSPQQAVDWNSITTGANTFYNYGTVQATGNDAIRPGVNGVVNNYAGGNITSANTTVAAAIAAGNGLSSDGIDAQTNSGVQIANSGTITGGRHGITGGNTTTGVYAMSITNNANATIQGNNGSGVNIDGINGSETVTIVNNGTITGNVTALNAGETAHDGDGVDVDGLVNLTNTGTIQSLNSINDTSEGVTVGGGTIVNSGTILGTVNGTNNGTGTGKGITILGIDNAGTTINAMYGNTVITNGGSIRGTTNSGITIGYDNAPGVTVVASGFSSTVNNLAGGTIEGGGATAAAIQTGPDNDMINNAGKIVADSSGVAIDLGAGNNTLNVTGGGASITGNVSGGTGGTNTLAISPGAGNAFAYSGTLSNFATVSIGASQTGANGTTAFAGGRVTLSGANTYAGTTTIYNGATLVANTPVAAGSATGTGAVSILSGGTLAGTGFVAGGVTLAGGGSLSPGDNGVGTLSLGSGLNVSNGASFSYDLGADDLHSDRLTLAGTLAFTGAGQMVFNLDNAGGLVPGTYDLIDFTSSTGLTTANLGFGTVPSGFSGVFNLSGTEISLTVTAVPEPSTWVPLAAAVAVLIVRRRWSQG